MPDPIRPDYFSGSSNPHAPCPNCGNSSAGPVSFTWWGGVLGPRLLHHVRCQNCQECYNGKTGRSNNTAITIYVVVSALIGIGIFVLYMFAKK